MVSHAQIVTHRMYDYQENQVYLIKTKITVKDSVKFEGLCGKEDDCTGWVEMATFKLDKSIRFKGRVIYFFHNENNFHLILEHKIRDGYLIIRQDTKHHPKKLLFAYYDIYDQG